MTREFEYECDGGTIMVGNDTCRVSIPNGFGDGGFTITVSDKYDYELRKNMDWNWRGAVEGDNIHIYSYDCLHGDDTEEKESILYTLPSGRYGIYVAQGDVIIEKWR